MNSREKMLRMIHKLYREDAWIQALFNSAGMQMDDIEKTIKELEDQYFFDTVTYSLPIYEKELAIKAASSINERRSNVEAKWKTSGKVDITLLQAVADSWRNGKVEVKFEEGKIKIDFVGEFGIPEGLDGLEKAMDDAKPAHLAIAYAFRYLLIKDIHEVMSHREIEQTKLNKFAGGTRNGK